MSVWHLILCVFGMIWWCYARHLCLSLCPTLNFALWCLFILTTSIRKGVPGEESEWPWCGEAVCHEGFEEGHYCTKGKDGWAHTDGAASAGAHSPVSVPRHTSLRLPDGYQIAPDTRLGCFKWNCLPCTAGWHFCVMFIQAKQKVNDCL